MTSQKLQRSPSQEMWHLSLIFIFTVKILWWGRFLGVTVLLETTCIWSGIYSEGK